MSDRPIVILHGWSDVSNSFQPLARLLHRRLSGRQVSFLHLADYISMEDEVRFDDIVSSMTKAWADHRLPTAPGSVDAIVHSTGGLVIRDWLQRNYPPGYAPIKHLVMLAPANFGSPLAHKGRSLLGRLWKGFIVKRPKGGAFQTGTHILKGLELASPYTWQLAERDRFGDYGNAYGPGNILCTVLVGQHAKSASNAVADEDGWDGVVRVSTANLDCARLEIVFPTDPDIGGPRITAEEASGLTAFAVLDQHDHGSITLAQTRGRSLASVEQSRRDGLLLSDIVRALTISDEEFSDWRDQLAQRNSALLQRVETTRNPEKHGYQNTLIRMQDQFGVGVEDYLLEFFEKDNDKTRHARRTHRAALRSVHSYSDDSSHRSFFVDCTSLAQTIDKYGEFLGIGLTAEPQMGDGEPVGFPSYGDDTPNAFRIPHDRLNDFLRPNRTVLITVQLARRQSDSVFRFNAFT